MPVSIEVDDEVWEALKSKAEPFVDTPNDVIRRVLGLNGSAVAQKAVVEPPVQQEPPAARTEPPQLRLDGQPRKRKNRGRLPRGERTSVEEFRLPIIQALAEMGGQGKVSEVLNRVGEIMADVLRPVDFGKNSSGSVRWINTAQWERHNMVVDGLLDERAPRGVWRMTGAGNALAQEHGLWPSPLEG